MAVMVPNVTKVSDTIDFEDQEAMNSQVDHTIPPNAYAVKWTGDVLIKQRCAVARSI